MLATFPSRSGPLSASYRGKQLHSAFDPGREAARFVEAELPIVPATVIAIGPGLGYLIGAIHDRRPDCRVIAMFLSPECHDGAVDRGACAWHPGHPARPSQFLDSCLDELESASLTVVEWPPASICFPEQAERVRNAVADVVHRHHASLLTEGANGRRWYSNLLRNFRELDGHVTPRAADASRVAACLIAASGPTLEEALGFLPAMRSKVSLWVVGSALDAVLAHGLQPDLVLSTDSAIYASEYVRAATTDTERSYPVAAPLTASRGIADACPVWCLQQNDPMEAMLYSRLPEAPTQVPAHGTVTGTALQLALAIHEWPVVVAGMDFAWNDLLGHARPHVADLYRDISASRLAPAFSDSYRKAREMKPIASSWATDAAMTVYARWFAGEAARIGGRVSRLLPSPADDSVEAIGADGLAALPDAFHPLEFAPAPWPGREERDALAGNLQEKCARSLDQLAAEPSIVPNPLQATLLRRFALDALIRWRISGRESDLGLAARQARLLLDSVGGSSP